MGIFKRLSNLMSSSSGGDSSAYMLQVKCDRCEEIVSSRVDLRNDLSAEFGASGAPDTYICRKVLVGGKQCFERLEVTLKFDQKKRLVDRQVKGGTFVDE